MNTYEKDLLELKDQTQHYVQSDLIEDKTGFEVLIKDCDTILKNMKVKDFYSDWELGKAVSQTQSKFTNLIDQVPAIKEILDKIKELEEAIKKTKSTKKADKFSEEIKEFDKQLDTFTDQVFSSKIEEIPTTEVPGMHEKISYSLMVDISKIIPNPYQPRKTFNEDSIQELARSIEENGLLQSPVVVWLENGDYQLVVGERRVRACKSLGLTEIPVMIHEMSDAEMATAAVIENLQREDVNMLEQAEGIKKLMEIQGLTQSQVAKNLGITQAKISQWVSLLDLSKEIKKMLLDGQISQSIGRVLSSLPTDVQDELIKVMNINELTAKKAQHITNVYKSFGVLREASYEDYTSYNTRFCIALLKDDCIDILATVIRDVNINGRSNLDPKNLPNFTFQSHSLDFNFSKNQEGKDFQSLARKYMWWVSGNEIPSIYVHYRKGVQEKAINAVLPVLLQADEEEKAQVAGVREKFEDLPKSILEGMDEKNTWEEFTEEKDWMRLRRIYDHLVHLSNVNESKSRFLEGIESIKPSEINKEFGLYLIQSGYVDLSYTGYAFYCENETDDIEDHDLFTFHSYYIPDYQKESCSLYDILERFDFLPEDVDNVKTIELEIIKEKESGFAEEAFRLLLSFFKDQDQEWDMTEEVDEVTGKPYDQLGIPEDQDYSQKIQHITKTEIICTCGVIIKKGKQFIKKDGQELCLMCGQERNCVVCGIDTRDDMQSQYINDKDYCCYHVPEEVEEVEEVEEEKSTIEVSVEIKDSCPGGQIQVPILNNKPEKSKTGKILQILQEDRKETHSISDKCYNCRNFNLIGKMYQDRCNANVRFHSFKRYAIEGQEFFTCDNFSPTKEFIEKRKSFSDMNIKTAMFEMLLYSEGMYNHGDPDLFWLKNYFEPFKGISPLRPKIVVDYFRNVDEETQNYLVEIVSKRYLLSKARSSGNAPLHTTQGMLKVTHKSLENAEDI